MTTTVLVGLQWGDEAKAKIVDIFAAASDLVVRYSGGANAGHTVVIGKEKYVLHLVPVGILRPQKLNVIANGVVVDLERLFAEIDTLRSRGFEVGDNLLVSARCHLTLPYHKALERMDEATRQGRAIKTTLRGVGPTFVDKFARDGIMVCDLFRENLLMEKLRRNTSEKNFMLSRCNGSEHFDPEALFEGLMPYSERLRPFVGDASRVVSDCIDQHKRVLFEGAQGSLLDVEHGTYPFVTTSYPTCGGVCVGSGIPPSKIDRIVGVTKAYCTRVGAGPFPTEEMGEAGSYMADRGQEFGATTGRPRRCGWLDLVALRYAIRINGISSLVVTKLDVLDGLDEVRICLGYEFEGKTLDYLPPEIDILEQSKPIYVRLPGWSESTSGATELSQLPKNAVAFLRRIEEETGAKIGLVSTAAERRSNILLDEHLLANV